MSNQYEKINDVWEQHTLYRKYPLFACLYALDLKNPEQICKKFLNLKEKNGCVTVSNLMLKYNILFNSKKSLILSIYHEEKMMLFDVEKGTIEVYRIINKKDYMKLTFVKDSCIVKGVKNNKDIDKAFTTLIGMEI